ncbi:hypothetical protein N9C80_03020 [Paracoccaceae bacterium]|nr:hypothetical protein [Paracoccaceae bacterium]
MAITLTTRAKNAALDGIVDEIDSGGSGNLQILDAAGNELATLPLTNPAFGAASDGSVTANSITTDTTVNAGTATQFKVFTSGGSEVFRGTVTVTSGGGDLTLTNVNLFAGDTLAVSSFTLTI